MNQEDFKKENLRRKRKALYRFRAIVRLVILNRFWLNEIEDQKMGPNIKRNIALITRRKGKKGLLSITEKALLKKPPEDRTPAERRRLVSAISTLKCFLKYPPRVRSRLAAVSLYMFYEEGKVILKEGHKANAMYFILDGEIMISRKQFDHNTNQYVNREIGIMEPGDTFGEVALLDKTNRMATCTCNTNVELICIYAADFDKILRETLQAQWDQIATVVNRFDIFKSWTKTQLRECCMLSKIKEYDPLQMIYYEDKGLLNFVYFVLSGQCTILQYLKIETRVVNNRKIYKLSAVPLKESTSHEIMNQISVATAESKKKDRIRETIDDKQEDLNLNIHNVSEFIRKSLTTAGLDENTEASSQSSRYTTRTESATFFDDNYKKEQGINIEHHFIDVGTLTCGAVFGLGENMEHRMIMAKTQVQCLLIPRFWLMQKAQNVANIWRRTQMYLEATIPSRYDLYRNFLANRKWRKYKKSLINDIVSQKVNVNATKVEDIPIICRIVEAGD